MSFSAQIKAFSKKAKRNSLNVFRMSCIEVSNRIINMSPVGDPDGWKSNPPPGYSGGRFRANWQAEINTAPSGDISNIDKSGGATKSKAQSKSMRLSPGNRFYLVNNLPYAKRLEDGYSGQAPQGMVKLAASQWKSIVWLVNRKVSR